MRNAEISAQLRELHRAFNENEGHAMVACYDEKATVVSKPGNRLSGRQNVAEALAEFRGDIASDMMVSNGDDVIIEAGDIALVISKIYLNYSDSKTPQFAEANRAIYVFRRDEQGQWRCAVDNFFGTDLLDYI